ncbi:hypothetical protein [Methanopyrus sp.]
MTPVIPILIAFSILATASPEPVRAGGPLAEHLRHVYGEDWPHYAPWVHSEIKVADDVKAYNLRPVDFECNLLPEVPARGVLVAYATQTELGLAFVNETGELLKLREVSIGVPPKYREELDFDYISGSNNEKDVLVVWGADKDNQGKLYMLHVKLGVRRLHEDVNLPTVVNVSNITVVNLPPGYKDVRRVRVLALGDEFVVFFTARREDKPTEEYGYDLFYAIARVENGTVKLEVGPADLGFQDVMTFQVRKLPLKASDGVLLGLAVMGRWRQCTAGVWWATLKLEGNSMKVVQVTRVSDDDFRVPCVERALLDFNYHVENDKCYVLVTWNDCRAPYKLYDRLYEFSELPRAFSRKPNNTWVVYGQRLVIYNNCEVKFLDDRGNECEKPKNFPLVYLMIIGRTVGIGGSVTVEFGEIDSIVVYSPSSGDQYFIVDASINTSDASVSSWLLYALNGEFVNINTHGFDIFSIPVPIEGEMKIATEVDYTNKLYIAYPVFNKGGSDVIPNPECTEGKPNPESFIYLYDTMQFGEGTTPDQIDIKVGKLSDGVIIEGFIETKRGEKNYTGSLFVIPIVVVVGPVRDVYKNYCYYDDPEKFLEILKEEYPEGYSKFEKFEKDLEELLKELLSCHNFKEFENKIDNFKQEHNIDELTETDLEAFRTWKAIYRAAYMSAFIYPLEPFTVLKFRPIRTEDHPTARAGQVVYDLSPRPPSIPTADLEVSYTTDFTDRVPLGSGLVEIVGPTRPEGPVPGAPLSGYAVMSRGEVLTKSRNVSVTVLRIPGKTTGKGLEETTKVCVGFLPAVLLPPVIEALECVAQVVESGVVDEGTLRAAQNALDGLNKLDERDLPRDVRDYLAYLRKVLEDLCSYAGKEMKKSNTKRVSLNTRLIIELNAAMIGLKRIVEGTYHVFVLYHPMGTVDNYPGFVDDKTKSLFDELAYTGVLSWVPIDVKCEVPTATLRRGRTGVRPGTEMGAVPPTEAPVVLPPTKPTGTQPTQPQKREERKVTTPPKVRKPTGGTPKRVPLLPVIPYRRGLSRPRLRRRSCTFKAR